MLGGYLDCTCQPEFLGEIAFMHKWPKMVKNDQKMEWEAFL